MDKLIQTLISGLSLGSIYALIALGYTMVYGIAKMLNFAHGDIIMVGAYAVITAVFTMGLPPFIAILISIALCALLGIVIEFLAYRPLRQAQPLAVLITAIGVSYLLQNLALLIYGSEQKAFPTIVALPTVHIGGVYIDGITLATLVVTAVIMVALSLFINKTRMGTVSYTHLRLQGRARLCRRQNGRRDRRRHLPDVLDALLRGAAVEPRDRQARLPPLRAELHYLRLRRDGQLGRAGLHLPQQHELPHQDRHELL